MSRTLDVTSFMIRDEATGEYDLDQTLSRFKDLAETYVTLHQNDVEKIGAAINGWFEKNPKANAQVPALKSIVMGSLWDGNPASHGPLMDRIAEVLSGSREVIVEKGPGKGARLRSEGELAFYDANGRDMTKEEKETAIEEARKAAAR